MGEFVIENRIWNPEMETMPVEDIKKLQLKKLKETVAHAANVPFYRDEFAKRKITPESIKSLDDLARLPFTTKEEMRSGYPFGLFGVQRSQLIRIDACRGSTGYATIVGYT